MKNRVMIKVKGEWVLGAMANTHRQAKAIAWIARILGCPAKVR